VHPAQEPFEREVPDCERKRSSAVGPTEGQTVPRERPRSHSLEKRPNPAINHETDTFTGQNSGTGPNRGLAPARDYSNNVETSASCH
jgi:hypothetical protein